MSRPHLAGILLAGGASRRFGSDKALAVVDGVTLLDRAAACLRTVCDGPVLVASGDGASRPGVLDGQVADLLADAGPLSAIGAGLAALGRRGVSGGVAVLAVDHLAPSVALLSLLADRRGDATCALAEVGGRLQPLQAVWSVACAEDVAASVAAGERSVLGWLASRDDVVIVDEATVLAAGIPIAVAHDVDRPEDLPG